MPALSTAQQAAHLVHAFNLAVVHEGEFPTCTFYRAGGNNAINLIPHGKLDRSQCEFISRLFRRHTDLDEGATHPVPPGSRIILGGNELTHTTEVVQAVHDLIAWVRTDEAQEYEEHALILPGAIVLAEYDGDDDKVRVQIAFPIQDRPLYESDLRQQAKFATGLIDRVNCPMNVLLNGMVLEKVPIGTNHTTLMREYRQRKDEDDEDLNILALVEGAIAYYEVQLALLRAWARNPDQALLPGGFELIDRERGILAFLDDAEGAVTLIGDPDDLDEEFMEPLREHLTD